MEIICDFDDLSVTMIQSLLLSGDERGTDWDHIKSDESDSLYVNFWDNSRIERLIIKEWAVVTAYDRHNNKICELYAQCNK